MTRKIRRANAIAFMECPCCGDLALCFLDDKGQVFAAADMPDRALQELTVRLMGHFGMIVEVGEAQKVERFDA